MGRRQRAAASRETQCTAAGSGRAAQHALRDVDVGLATAGGGGERRARKDAAAADALVERWWGDGARLVREQVGQGEVVRGVKHRGVQPAWRGRRRSGGSSDGCDERARRNHRLLIPHSARRRASADRAVVCPSSTVHASAPVGAQWEAGGGGGTTATRGRGRGGGSGGGGDGSAQTSSCSPHRSTGGAGWGGADHIIGRGKGAGGAANARVAAEGGAGGSAGGGRGREAAASTVAAVATRPCGDGKGSSIRGAGRACDQCSGGSGNAGGATHFQRGMRVGRSAKVEASSVEHPRAEAAPHAARRLRMHRAQRHVAGTCRRRGGAGAARGRGSASRDRTTDARPQPP